MRRIILLAGLILAGCGSQQGLAPAPGQSLPVKPATAPTTPSADALLTQPPNIRPGRNDEVLTKSTTRPDDRFDLPPH